MVASLVDAFDVPQGTTTERLQFVLPGDVPADQRFHVYPQIDPNDEFVELDEGNNATITDEPNFGTGFDVEPTGCVISSSPFDIFPGGAVEFDVTIENLGVPYVDPLDIRLWASPDRNFNVNEDILIGDVQTGPLAEAAEVVATVGATLPTDLEPGSYFPICIADPDDDFAELDAADGNTFIGRPQDQFAIVPPPLEVLDDELPAATVGTPYEYEVQVTGGTFMDRSELTFTGRDLPDGLELSAAGVVEGVPLQPSGDEPDAFRVDVTDGGEIAQRIFELEILPSEPLELVETELPTGTLGEAYSAQLETTGGLGEVTFALTAGALPPGLVLSIDGVVSGTPDERGTFEATISARDTPPRGAAQSEDEATITIDIGGDDFAITTTSLPTGTRGESYEARVETAGGVLPIAWSLAAGNLLPGGLTGEASDDTSAFVISGRPQNEETVDVTLEATDGLGRTVSQTLTFDIEADEPVCPGDPACPPDDDPGPAGSSGGCAAAGTETLAPVVWLGLAFGIGTLRRRRRPA